jgi:hypothetical protein
MTPIRSIPVRTLLLVIVILPVLAGCGSTQYPRTLPTSSPSVTAPSSPSGTPTPTPTTATPTPTPSQTSPGPGWTVVSAQVAYPWRWPNVDNPASVGHSYPVPPVAQLVAIGAANHSNDPGERPYNRMSFTFTTAFPSYRFEYVEKLVADPSDRTISLAGLGVLRIVFNPAQAHRADGSSSIVTQPSANLGLNRMVSYARAGDFESYLSYGIGITWPNPDSNPQIAVRVYEVTYVNAQGEHRYVVAIDVDAR